MTKDALTRTGGTAARFAGLLVTLGFHAAWLSQPLGWRLTAFHLLLTALAIARPTAAAVALAGLVPLTTSLSVVLRSPFPGRTLVLAMLWAITTGVLTSRPRPARRLRTRLPALLVAVTAIASAIVAVVADPLVITTYPTLRSLWMVVRSGDVFHWARPWISVHYAVLTALGLLILVFIEGRIRERPATARWLIGSLLIAHGLAAALSVVRLATAPARAAGRISLWQLLGEVRFHSQYDVNAAGSALVIVLLAGVGLALSLRLPWQRALAWGAVGAALVGLWLSGSRAALAAALLVFVAKPLVKALARPSRRALLGALAAVTVGTVLAGLLYALYPVGRNARFATAFETRRIMLRTAINAGSSAPVFGIGIGRFQDRAYEFGSVDIVPYMGPAGVRENAHNQFLQTFAELGLVGVLGLLLLTASALAGALRREDDRLRAWTAWGVVATFVTWLLGHPLLVPEYAIVLWIVLGVVAGLAAPLQARPRAGVASMVVAAMTFAVVIVTPIRGWTAVREVQLEHFGVGVSPYWIHDGGVSYRAAADRFALFVPSSASVVVPLRASDRRYGHAQVEVWLHGRLINRVQLPEVGWLQLRMLIPGSEYAFERVDFVVTIPGHTPGSEDELVHVGRTGITPAISR